MKKYLFMLGTLATLASNQAFSATGGPDFAKADAVVEKVKTSHIGEQTSIIRGLAADPKVRELMLDFLINMHTPEVIAKLRAGGHLSH
jgi:hypothetical protein